MKDFLKFTFASVIGVILAGVVFTILGIITLVGIVASSDTETVVKDNSIFVLDFKGSLSERVQENPLQQLLGEEFEAYGLDDILASIKKAKDNDKIKGIYIQPSYLEASYASLEEIRNALLDFKESGKFIVAYADQYAQGMYYLSSVADKIIINPQGSIGWHGAGMQPVFFKNLVSKLGLEVQVFRVGTYKSAVEPFIATEMSPANREQMTECLESVWHRILADVSDSRRIPTDTLNAYADRYMDFCQAEEYIQCKPGQTTPFEHPANAALRDDAAPVARLRRRTGALLRPQHEPPRLFAAAGRQANGGEGGALYALPRAFRGTAARAARRTLRHLGSVPPVRGCRYLQVLRLQRDLQAVRMSKGGASFGEPSRQKCSLACPSLLTAGIAAGYSFSAFRLRRIA